MTQAIAEGPATPERRLPMATLMWVVVGGQLCLTIYLPSIPGMVTHFGGDQAGVQMTLTAYLVSFTICQLIVGPLSDRLGRRPVLIGCLVLHVVAAVISAWAPTLAVLIAARVVQGAGACAGAVLARAIVRDVATREAAARKLSILSTAFALAPAVGPLIGGQIHAWLGWRANFAFLAIMGVTGLTAVLLRLAETRPVTQAGAQMRPAAGFAAVLKNRRFLVLSLTVGSTAATFYAFITAGPLVLIGLLGVAPEVFGLFTLAWAGSFITANAIALRFLKGVDPMRLMAVGIWLTIVAGAIMIATGLTVGAHVLAVAIPFAMIGFGNGFIVPNGMAMALTAVPSAVGGTASAVLGALQMAIGIVVSAVMGLVTHASELPLGINMLLAGLFGLGGLLIARRG